MPDRFPCFCYKCGYWSLAFVGCGLEPDDRAILCPFADARPELISEGGDCDAQQLD